ncbi:MAG: adenylate kinase [Planctomycetes bacterium]|nr:adenylate kinase [Planctomycetota bacterium]
MRLVFLGPPGVGKGTQSKRVGETLGIPHIATGDILRDAVARETETGRKAKGFMDRGDLVPDALVIEVFKDRLRQPDTKAGFLLDGFPRTIEQCRALDACLLELGTPLDRAINLEAARSAIIERLSGRLLCRSCQAGYHVKHLPPKCAGKCDACGGELYQRADDNPQTIGNRLDVYERQTAPVVEFFRAKRLLTAVDADAEVETVYRATLAALGR